MCRPSLPTQWNSSAIRRQLEVEIFQHMSHLKNAQTTEEKMQNGLGSAACCFISPPPTAPLPPAKHNSSIRTGKLAENIIPTIRNQRRRLKCWQCRILACIYSHLVQHAQMPNHWVSLTRCSSRMSHLLSAAPTIVVSLRNLTAAQKSGPYRHLFSPDLVPDNFWVDLKPLMRPFGEAFL